MVALRPIATSHSIRAADQTQVGAQFTRLIAIATGMNGRAGHDDGATLVAQPDSAVSANNQSPTAVGIWQVDAHFERRLDAVCRSADPALESQVGSVSCADSAECNDDLIVPQTTGATYISSVFYRES